MSTIKVAATEFLSNKRVAVTGVSREPSSHGSNVVYKRLRERGYEVFAVNPNAKEVEGDRTFPILIGLFEAESINTGVKRVQSPRPRTHELLVQSIEALGGQLDSVVISELKDHIYFAKLRVKREGELVEIDSRPSDAIAVAVACDPILPIYVAEEVLEESSAR